MADKGTLFLDEIGDIPLELQCKLLRVLQGQEFERLGSSRTLRVDFRLVAATNQDLGQMVERTQFRSDLYYRLNVFPIDVPALRHRAQDIVTLVWHFTKIYAQRMNRRIEAIREEDMDAMTQYEWPGNVRELQNFIERSVILSNDGYLRPPVTEGFGQGVRLPISSRDPLAEAERRHIMEILHENRLGRGRVRRRCGDIGCKTNDATRQDAQTWHLAARALSETAADWRKDDGIPTRFPNPSPAVGESSHGMPAA